MAEQANTSGRTVYDVRCGDNTGGKVTAETPEKARDMAEEMCLVHGGAKGDPTPRA
jgi:hypothetical protein